MSTQTYRRTKRHLDSNRSSNDSEDAVSISSTEEDDNYVKTNEKPHLESCQEVKIKTDPGCEEVNRQNIIQRFIV